MRLTNSLGYFSFIFLALTISSIADNSHPQDTELKIANWEQKPYIYKENDTIKGILPDVLSNIKLYCRNGTNFKYDNVLKSRIDFNYNLTHPQRMTPLTLWGPLITTSSEDELIMLDKLNLTSITLLQSQKMVIVVKREKISLTHKIGYGLVNITGIVFVIIITGVLFGITIWIFDNHDTKKTPHTVLHGVSRSVWCSFVTLFTVGYGDVVPTSRVSKFLTVGWILMGILMAGIATSIITENISEIDIHNFVKDTMSVLNNSMEEKTVLEDYHVKPVLLRESYSAVLDAVRNGESEAALLNADVAASIQHEIRDDNHKNPLRIIQEIEKPHNIFILIPKHLPARIANDLKCAVYYRRFIFEKAELDNKRYYKLETIHTNYGIDIIKSSIIVKTLAGILPGFILLGLLLELWQRQQKNPNKKRVP